MSLPVISIYIEWFTWLVVCDNSFGSYLVLYIFLISLFYALLMFFVYLDVMYCHLTKWREGMWMRFIGTCYYRRQKF